ncbi:MAG: response regulator [Edaphobacter sp.]
MGRRILLVDDEVAVLLTLKAVLEISGFEVDTAASAREGVSKLHTREYQMLITDMRMEHDVAGVEVIKAARAAAYRPAVALLTAFPVAEEDWQEMGADQLLVKPMHTRVLLQQIEELFDSHVRKLESLGIAAAVETTSLRAAAKVPARKSAAQKKAVKPAAKKAKASKPAARRSASVKKAAKKTAPRKKAVAKKKAASALAKRIAAKAKSKVKKGAKTSSRGKPRVAARRKKS